MTFPDELTGWHRELRARFPQIAAHPDLAYLDSAATAQKPQPVLDAVVGYLTTGNANAARGTYPWANRTTARIEQARDRVRRFLGDTAPAGPGVHFTGGTTEGLRTIALDWLVPQLRDGDRIVVPFADHEANIAPWQEAAALARRQGAAVDLVPMPYDATFDYDTDRLAALVAGGRVRLVAATHVHHVYGHHLNVERVRAAVGVAVPVSLDAAQGIGHRELSTARTDVDFVVFSGHKAMALPGIGAIWARNRRGPEFRPGGWAGSPNTSGIVSLAAALDWLDAAGVDRIARWTTALGLRLTDGLSRLPSFTVLGCQANLTVGSRVPPRHGIVAFRHRDIGAGDLGFILAAEGILVRADGHCQGDQGEKTASVRASVHAYTAPHEVDHLLAVLGALDRAT